jgi:Flp pilus assembly protein TadG
MLKMGMLKMGMLELGMLRRFATDRRGVAALEFALLAPVMVTAYFGTAELTEGLMAARKISAVASAVGDLTAQGSVTTPGQMSDVFNIGTQVMQPYATTASTLKQRVSSVTVDSKNVPRVDWSQASSGYAALAKGSAVALPTGSDGTTPFVGVGQSVIMAEAHYTFTSPVAQYLPATSDLHDTIYLMPRSGSTVTCSTC